MKLYLTLYYIFKIIHCMFIYISLFIICFPIIHFVYIFAFTVLIHCPNSLYIYIKLYLTRPPYNNISTLVPFAWGCGGKLDRIWKCWVIYICIYTFWTILIGPNSIVNSNSSKNAVKVTCHSFDSSLNSRQKL